MWRGDANGRRLESVIEISAPDVVLDDVLWTPEDGVMPWAYPQYSRSQVDKAGQMICCEAPSSEDEEHALRVINNWRSSHSFPLNTFQMGLRNRSHRVDTSAIVAQRIKRLTSIKAKLINEPTMKLSKMQDIGGCRAVIDDVEAVYALRDAYRSSHLKHHLVKENDYIAEPKRSGYRSLHRVYRYMSDREDTYNGLQIEVQMRSRLQHAWATAVETVGTFLMQSLKASQGSAEWLRFFKLMGTAHALREGTVPVPGTPSSRPELVGALRRYVKRLNVDVRLRAYGTALDVPQMPEVRGAKYFLMELNLKPSQHTIRVESFASTQLPLATDRYLDIERALEGPGSEAVLVSVDSLSALRRAYPNYFLDTQAFLESVMVAIS